MPNMRDNTVGLQVTITEQTEQMAAFLSEKGIAAAWFHSQLPPETKKDVQARFIRGDLRVIAATNAFGMGIDKPDVRLVIHADMPGSLENYLQEAGRAGRDRAAARCILLYTPDDVERQFGMSARSRLTQREIQGILRSLRRLDHRKRGQGEVVATAGQFAEDGSILPQIGLDFACRQCHTPQGIGPTLSDAVLLDVAQGYHTPQIAVPAATPAAGATAQP